MEPLLIAGVVGGTVLLVGLFVTSVVAERADIRDSLRRLEGYQIPDVRGQEMLAPISERVVTPVLEGLASLTQRLTPQGYREQVARKLVLSGAASKYSVDQILLLNHRMLGMGVPAAVLTQANLVQAYGGQLHLLSTLEGTLALGDTGCDHEEDS